MSPTPAEAFFDAIAGRYERSYAPSTVESRRRMARILAALPSSPSRVLDLGVGTGRELSALLDAGHAPTGLDASRSMLERCSRRARPVPLVRADFWVAPLPFDAGEFDAVIALHGTLAHPPDGQAIGRLAAELARVVRAGGVFVAEAPSPAWLERVGGGDSGDARDALRDTLSQLSHSTSPLPQPGSVDDRRVRRTSGRTCVYEDLVTGASIEATVLDEAEWRGALAPRWSARLEPVDGIEWLVVAHRDHDP